MTRDELVTYLLLKADAFDGHPVHVDMADALREAATCVHGLTKYANEENWALIKPLLRSNGQPPHAPDDT